MKIHKEGNRIIVYATAVIVVLNMVVFWFMPSVQIFVLLAGILIWFFIIMFFRNPEREILIPTSGAIYAPADGKIVAIEEVQENEYFQDRRIQVSIFMSPTNIHVNRNPIDGKVNYFRYHPGKYLVAWHPKSSTENERTTVVIGNDQGEVLLRQIAGFLAKRIVNYFDEGQEVRQGEEMGFIKFGSRVDLFLPLSAKVEIRMNQKVRGNRTVIARL